MYSPGQIPVFVELARNLSKLPYKGHLLRFFLCVLTLPTGNMHIVSQDLSYDDLEQTPRYLP